jgi:hypothetical protein
MVAVRTNSTTPSFSADRRTHYINRRPASHIRHAVAMAPIIGCPLNTFVSINFFHTTCPPELVSVLVQRVIARFRKWATRPPAAQKALKVSATHIWVIENPPQSHINAHWLLHVPAGRTKQFERQVSQWLEAEGYAINNSAAIKIQTVDNPYRVSTYMLKGIDPAYATFFRAYAENQGMVIGKRSGYSQNLGPTQKKRLVDAGKYRKPYRRGFPSS